MEAWRNELYHYGVLGQKWGVRRYQNYDGSYTRRGLLHYNRSKDIYEKRKNERKAIQKSGEKGLALSAAKQREKEAKYAMNQNYKQLKNDYKADHGKALYNTGHTITDNNEKTEILGTITAIGTIASYKLLADKGSKYIKGIGNVPVNALTAASIAAGGGLVTALASAKVASDNSKLRAYYGHSAKYMDLED